MIRAPLVIASLVGSLVLAPPTLAQSEAAVPPVSRGNVVMFIGGIDSRLDGGGNWDMLEQELQRSFGFSTAAFIHFSYQHMQVPDAGSSITSDRYGLPESCQPIATSEDKLVLVLRSLRENHSSENVALVGHSLGGVIAVQALVDAPDLSPFVSSVVAADAPFGGVTPWASLVYSGCASIDELIQRRQQSSQWRTWFLSGAQSVLGRGTRLEVVTNDMDALVGVKDQCICGLPIHLDLSMDGPASGHAGVLYSTNATRQMASFITRSVAENSEWGLQ